MTQSEQLAADAATPAPMLATERADGSGRRQRLDFLDSVRALSALYVVVHHLFLAVFPGFPVNTGPGFLDPVLYGHFGVAIFIVVSGFSLALAPARSDHQLVGGFRRFIRRRAWRILPPYWAALALSVAIVGFIIQPRMDHPLSLRGVVTHLLLVQDVVEGPSPNGAFWSIAVEWQLYFVFPLFLGVRRRLGAAAVALATLGLVAAIKLAEDRTVLAGKLLHLSPQFAALFVFGILSAAVTVRPPGGTRLARWWGPVGAGASFAVAVACAAAGSVRAVANLFWLDLLVGVAVACGLAHLAGTPRSRLRRALDARALVRIGHYSYSLYLIHAPLLLVAWLYAVEPLGLSRTASFAVMVAVVGPLIMALSYLFHRCVERPFLSHRSMSELRARLAGGQASTSRVAR